MSRGTVHMNESVVCFKYALVLYCVLYVYVVDCGQPEIGSSARVSQSGTVFGSVATYTCLTGYEPDSGNLTRICQLDGSWSGQALNCSGMGFT